MSEHASRAPRPAGSAGSAAARLFGVVRLSARHLRHRFLESLLIVLGIAVGVGVLTGMESLLRYLVALDNETLRTMTLSRSVVVAPKSFDLADLYRGSGAPAIRIAGANADPVTLTVEDLLAARRDVAGIAFAMASGGPITFQPVVAVEGAPLEPRSAAGSPSPLSLMLTRITPDELPFEGRALVAGRLMTWEEYEVGSPVLVLEERAVRELFPGLAAHEAVGRTVTGGILEAGFQGIEWRIVGVVADRPQSPFPAGFDDQTSVPAYTSHTAGRPGPVALQQLGFAPADERETERLIRDLEVYFAQRLGPGRVTVTNPIEALRQIAEERRTVTLTLMGLAGLALLVASVNILNLMTAQVFRRRRLLATSVALGADRPLLFGRMAAEALLLGVGGSAVGLLLAQGIVGVLRGLLAFDAGLTGLPPLTLTAADALFGLGAGAFASMLFGLYPAFLSAAIDPADGLRVE